MGYTTGIKWNDEMIAEKVMRIASLFEPKRMPSNREVIEFEGNYKLANAIQKHGGYEYWANRLNLEQKYSETSLGINGERWIADYLKTEGFEVEPTPIKYPYDLLVDKCVKIDVKTANISHVKGYPIHSYRLAKEQQTCDFYILFEADTERIYVIPASKLNSQVQVAMGNDSKEYRQYINAFHLIKQASDMYQEM